MLLPLETNLRFICTSVLPKTAQSLLDINPNPPDNTTPIVEFDKTSYRVISGDQVEVTVLLTGTVPENSTASVDYHTTNGTIANGIDYNGVSGTLTWTHTDPALKAIPIQTGGPLFLFKWTPETTFYNTTGLVNYDPEKITLNISVDGKALTYNSSSGTNNVSYRPNFYTNRLQNIQVGDQIYYEFGFPILEHQNSSAVIYQIYTKLNNSDVIYPFILIGFKYSETTNSYTAYISINGGPNTNVPLNTAPQNGVRFGFLINDTHGVKVHINGHWINLSDFTQQSIDETQIQFTYLTYNNQSEVFNGAVFSTSSFDILAPDYTGTFTENNFSLTSYTGTDQVHNPGNVPNQILLNSISGLGNFHVNLTNPNNLSIFTNQTTVSVEGVNNFSLLHFSQPINQNLVTPEYARNNQSYPLLNSPYVTANLNWNETDYIQNLDFRLGSTNAIELIESLNPTILENYLSKSQEYQLNNIKVINTSITEQVNVVKELKITTWPGFDFFKQSIGYDYFFLLNNIITNYKPFLLTSNPDGSLSINAKWRTYKLNNNTTPTYVLVDYYNDNSIESLPKLLPLNIGITYNGLFYLNIFSYYDYYTDFISSVIDPIDGDIKIEPIIYYTLDGSEPNEHSSIYNKDNPPILTQGQSYILKIYQSLDGWINSDIQSVLIKTQNLNKTLSGHLTLSFTDNSYNPNINIGFNSDSIYHGYEYLLFTINTDPSISYNNGVIYYSLDGGITYNKYINQTPLSLPLSWKQPIGNAGNPNICTYIKDEDGKVSYIDVKSIPFYYPNWNLKFQDHSPNVTILDNIITLGSIQDIRTFFNCNRQLQTKLTSLDDYRYFEFEIVNITDNDKTLCLFVNNSQLFRNGDLLDKNTLITTHNPDLAWGNNDIIRVLINYKDGSVIFTINEGNNVYYTSGSTANNNDIINIGFEDSSYNISNVNGTIIKYLFKSSEQHYPYSNMGIIYSAYILPLDTSN